MPFIIKKNKNIFVTESGTIGTYIEKYAEQANFDQNKNYLEQKNIIFNEIKELKKHIYILINEISEVSTQESEQKIPIDKFNTINIVLNLSQNIKKECNFFRAEDIDTEDLDLLIEMLIRIKETGSIENSKSIKKIDYNYDNSYEMIESLKFYLGQPIVEFLNNNFDMSNTENDIDNIDKNLIDIIINGTEEERNLILNKYGIDQELFKEILENNKFLSRTKYITEDSFKGACKKFVESAIEQSSENKVRIEDYGFDISKVIKNIRMLKKITKKNTHSDQNDVLISDLSGTDFFLRYFFERDQMPYGKLSDALYNLMSDLSKASESDNSSIKNLSNPFSENEIIEIKSAFSDFINQDKIEEIEKRIQKMKEKLSRMPLKIQKMIEKSIEKEERKLLEISKSNENILSNLKIPTEKSNKAKKEINEKISNVQSSYLSYKNNNNDLGSLGFCLENYIMLYNKNKNKNPIESKKLYQKQKDLLNSTWYRFISPAYRFLRFCKDFIDALYRYNNIDKKNDIVTQSVDSSNNLQISYNNLINSDRSDKAISEMETFLYEGANFLSNISFWFSGKEKKQKMDLIIAELFKNINLIKVNLQNPESVIIFNNQNSTRLASSENNNYVLIQTYKVIKNG